MASRGLFLLPKQAMQGGMIVLVLNKTSAEASQMLSTVIINSRVRSNFSFNGYVTKQL